MSWYYRATELVFTDPTQPEPSPLRLHCELDIPDPGDANINGISDFFEVERPLAPAASNGEFTLSQGTNSYPGTVDMSWTRSAGSTLGTCRLRFQVPGRALDLTFEHEFEVYAYAGTLTYQVKGTNIAGTVALARAGTAGNLTGPFSLQRIDADDLSFASAVWTKESGALLRWYNSQVMSFDLSRGSMRSNYWGVLGTPDGMPDTPAYPEYQVWEVHLFDANDSDHDRIPDLSDVPLPVPPVLLLGRSGDRLRLQLTGEVGRRLTIEQTGLLPTTNWTEAASITLTNSVQTIDWPWPTAPAGFWRARAE
jgi:hypothetical protein